MALQFQPGQLASLFQQQRPQFGLEPMPPTAPDSGAPRPKLFGKGGVGWDILGVIGDSLLAANGQQGAYIPFITNLQDQIAKEKQFQQRLQAQAEQARAEREAANAEYDRRFGMQREAQRDYYDYQRENPKPVLVPDGMGGAQWITPPAYEGGAAPPQGLQPGHTEDGYTFMGGDPGDPSNWKQGGGAGGGTGMFP